MKLIEATETPVLQSQNGFGTLTIDHPLQASLAGNLVKLLAQKEAGPDFTVMLGSRSGMFLAGQSGIILPNAGCKFLQVDTDGAEIRRQIPVDVGVVSDAALALAGLYAEVKRDI